jgi:hypothetical protein
LRRRPVSRSRRSIPHPRTHEKMGSKVSGLRPADSQGASFQGDCHVATSLPYDSAGVRLYFAVRRLRRILVGWCAARWRPTHRRGLYVRCDVREADAVLRSREPSLRRVPWEPELRPRLELRSDACLCGMPRQFAMWCTHAVLLPPLQLRALFDGRQLSEWTSLRSDQVPLRPDMHERCAMRRARGPLRHRDEPLRHVPRRRRLSHAAPALQPHQPRVRSVLDRRRLRERRGVHQRLLWVRHS